jgi:hypothetical protein
MRRSVLQWVGPQARSSSPRRRTGLLIALAVASALALPALAAKDTPAPRGQRRFDHGTHADRMRAAGKGTEGCAGRCHRVETNGRWVQDGKREHARCFESCHTFETSCATLAAGAGKVCVTCHQNLKSSSVPSCTPRLAGRPPEMPASFSHKQHIKPGQSAAAACQGCHGAFGAGAPKTGGDMEGHTKCAGCHNRVSRPFMTQCASCHVAGRSGGDPKAGLRQRNPFAVTGAFDHVRHAAKDRVGSAGKDCLMCHGNIADAPTDRPLPMPTMQGCYGACHDGKRAFSATGATCTRCHKGGRP